MTPGRYKHTIYKSKKLDKNIVLRNKRCHFYQSSGRKQLNNPTMLNIFSEHIMISKVTLHKIYTQVDQEAHTSGSI